jgi:hypothetical protein
MNRRNRDVKRSVKDGCCFCHSDDEGQVYDVYAGFLVSHTERRAFLSSTTHIRQEYRGMKRIGLRVCPACEKSTRMRRHLPWMIGWGVGAALLGAGAVWWLVAMGAQSWGGLVGFGGFAALCALLSGLEAWELFKPGTSGAVQIAVVGYAGRCHELREAGDRFFGPEEYKVLFKDSEDLPLSAEELVSRAREDDTFGAGDRGDEPEEEPRRRKRKPKEEDTKRCPHCDEAIPVYARACSHCKKILK